MTVADPKAATVSPALRVLGVSKMYRIYDQPQDRLKQMLLGRSGRTYGREFWALREISFEIGRGETVGILGRNGSGKSTLLEILAGTLDPTTGEVEREGRVAALLELGSGFNPEFTGRENVFLNGAILGLGRKEMQSRLDAIVDFADIGQFIDQPVKVYSSGMFVRLAFAVATAVDADVLLIDEALAVGDVFFRQKCYRRLEDLRARGVAIVLVSHNPNDIEQFCDRAILLDHGQPLFQGPAVEAVKRYYLVEHRGRFGAAPVGEDRPVSAGRPGEDDLFTASWPASEAFRRLQGLTQVTDGAARCTAIAMTDDRGNVASSFAQGGRARFFFEFEALRPLEVPIGGIVIHDQRGVIVHGKNSLQFDCAVPATVPAGTRLRFRIDLDLALGLGEYSFEFGFASLSREDYQRRAAVIYAELAAQITFLCVVPSAGSFTVTLRPVGTRPIQLLHHGMADLPGECALSVVAAP